MFKIIFTIISYCFSTLSLAEFKVYVENQHGKPLENVVVSFESLSKASLPDKPVIMDQVNRSFVPKVIAINQGQKVSFPNSDNIRHHVYSFSKAKSFEIRLYRGTPSQPVMFEQPGVVVLGCNIHDKMIGYIYVGENNQKVSEVLAITDQNGMAVFNEKPDSQIWVWHENQTIDINTRQHVTFLQEKNTNIWRTNIEVTSSKEESLENKEEQNKFKKSKFR